MSDAASLERLAARLAPLFEAGARVSIRGVASVGAQRRTLFVDVRNAEVATRAVVQIMGDVLAATDVECEAALLRKAGAEGVPVPAVLAVDASLRAIASEHVEGESIPRRILRLVDATLGPQPLDMITAMGFLILLGVVVNNAILVVDGALARLRAGAPLAAAVRDAVEGRVRPIFMSSLTSLAGLLPLVLFPGSGSELYRGVGAVVLGGLALSTVLTLYMTPSLFTLLWRARGVR